MNNITTLEDRDPYVERLFEGFAFLSGRIRQKLEDDFPEFTQNLMEMVDPAFLRSIPSMAMLEIFFEKKLLPKSHLIPKGTAFLTGEVGDEKCVCRFLSTQDVMVHPITLENAEIVHHGVFGEGIKLEFQIDGDIKLSNLIIPEFSIYLHGERSLSYFLHYYFTDKISKIVMESDGFTQILGGLDLVEPGGFAENENLLPQIDNSFEGSRFLQEFFAFEEKFRFIKFKGFPKVQDFQDSQNFSLSFYFKETIPEGKRIKTENFKLYATPLINIFEANSEPVILNQKHFEYPCYADSEGKTEIYEVQKVTGMDKNTGNRRPYHKFNEFRHQVLTKGDDAEDSYWSARQEMVGKNRFQTYISVGSHKPIEALPEEYLSIEILASNGAIPRTSILEKAINVSTFTFPSFCTFSNFTRPSIPVYPPKSDHYLWYVLSHMNMNFRSLCQKGNLKEVLSLYDWTHSAVNKKLIDGLMGASTKKKNFLLESQLVSGAEITVEIRDGAFSEMGELHIFGRVLLEFFTQYSSINHLISLQVIQQPSGKNFTLAPREGRCHLI